MLCQRVVPGADCAIGIRPTNPIFSRSCHRESLARVVRAGVLAFTGVGTERGNDSGQQGQAAELFGSLQACRGG